jgi:RNA polymerase sigma-70 factor (ECF subfamily)
VGAWLVAIAKSSATDSARANTRRRGHEGRAACTDRTAEGADAGRADTVLGAIRSLPDAYREPLVLRFVAGLTGPQIAACLGMTHGSVRVNLHRGMAMLRKTLSEDRS